MSESSEISVLCRVCDCPAEGIYYDVYTCIPCRDFFHSNATLSEFQPCRFRRQCPIERNDRTDCSECRLKKCFNQLMRHPVYLETCPYSSSPDIKPSLEVVRHLNMNGVLLSLRRAHKLTYRLTDPRFSSKSARSDYQENPSSSCSGLMTSDNAFIPAIQGVIDFAKEIPCFLNLPAGEQNHLLHEGAIGVLLLRLADTFDPESNTIHFWNGRVIHRDPNRSEGEEFSWNGILDFAQKVYSFRLTNDEVNLFCLLLIINRYLPGLQTVLALKTHIRLWTLLQDLIQGRGAATAITTGDLLVLIYQINYLKELHNEIHTWKKKP